MLNDEDRAEDFANEMQRIKDAYYDDPELSHYYMDACICGLLRALGYGKGIDIFDSTYRWYS